MSRDIEPTIKLTLEQCQDILAKAPERKRRGKAASKKKTASKKKATAKKTAAKKKD